LGKYYAGEFEFPSEDDETADTDTLDEDA